MNYLKKLAFLSLLASALLALYAGWVRLSIVEQQVEYQSGDLTIRGTMLAPRFGGKAPGIVLVHGSGETSRKSMLLYAWLFAFKGYAALAYDKRGTGTSDGEDYEWREFSFPHLAADAAAGFRFLQSHNRVDPARVGFFGASQGGWVVALAANSVSTPAFLIMVSASVSTVAEDRIYGRAAQVRQAGFSENSVAAAVELIRADHDVTRSGKGYEEFLARWQRCSNADWFRTVYGNDNPLPLNDRQRAWERTVLDFDPVPLLNRLNVPTLWVFGDPRLDRFCPVELSVARVMAAKEAGKPYQLIQIENVGHTLELAQGGTLQTIMQVRLPLIRRIFRWLDDQENG